MVIGQDRIEDLLREFAPQVLAVLVHRYGQFDACEDAVQEALLAATLQWPGEGPCTSHGCAEWSMIRRTSIGYSV